MRKMFSENQIQALSIQGLNNALQNATEENQFIHPKYGLLSGYINDSVEVQYIIIPAFQLVKSQSLSAFVISGNDGSIHELSFNPETHKAVLDGLEMQYQECSIVIYNCFTGLSLYAYEA